MNFEEVIKLELQEATNVLQRFMQDAANIDRVHHAAKMMIACINGGGKIMACGNGGSSCDAMHFAEELTGRYRENREPIAAISISDSSHITCTANDYGYAHVFSRYVKALGNKDDVLLAISTSGNSENVNLAVEEAAKKGMKVVALTGKDGGKLATLADVSVIVPHFRFADRIQEVHIKIIHIIILLIEKGVSKS